MPLPDLPTSLHQAAARLMAFIGEQVKEGVDDRFILLSIHAEVTSWFVRTYKDEAAPTNETAEQHVTRRDPLDPSPYG